MSDKLGLHMNTAPADPSVPRPPGLLDQLRERIRLKHFSLRTERAYAQWVKRYIYFHGKRRPAELGKEKVEALLTSLAVKYPNAAKSWGWQFM
nr:C630 [uncultured bacterium]